MKRVCWGIGLAGVFALLAVLAACAGNPPALSVEGNAHASKKHTNYFAPADNEMSLGGKDSVSQDDMLVVQSVTVTAKNDKQGECTEVALTLSGGGDGLTPLTEPPLFELTSLPSPSRFILTLEGVTDFDYQSQPEAGTLVENFFELIPYDSQTGRISFIFRLREASAYQVWFEDSTLIVRLRPEGIASRGGFYTVLYAYNAMREGVLPPLTVRLTPALASDGEHKLLISKRYETKDEAMVARDSLQTELGDSVSDYYLEVAYLEGNLPPEYNNTPVSQGSVITIDGESHVLPVVTTCGELLAVSPDASLRLYRSSRTGTGDSVSLFLQKNNSQPERLMSNDRPVDMDDPDEASFSPDNRYIILADRLQGDPNFRIPILYDLKTGTLNSAVSDVPGIDTVFYGFSWGADSRSVYVISGRGALAGGPGYQLRVLKIAEDGTLSTETLEERRANEGMAIFTPQSLYFTQREEDDFYLYRLDDAERVLVSEKLVCDNNTDAPLMTVSAQGKALAFGTENRADNGETHSGDGSAYGITLLNPANGETRQIYSGTQAVCNLRFAPDTQMLYYCLLDLEKDFDTYTVMSYDVATGISQTLFTTLIDVRPAGEGLLYLSTYTNIDGAGLALTFAFDPAEDLPVPQG